MLLTKIRKNKFEIIVISIAFLISVIWSLYNLKNFDNNRINFKGNWYNQLIYADIGHNWSMADDFKKNLQKGESFFEALPTYEKYFLPVIMDAVFSESQNNSIIKLLDKYENNSNYELEIRIGKFEDGFIFDLCSDDNLTIKKSFAAINELVAHIQKLRTYFKPSAKVPIVLNLGGFTNNNFVDEDKYRRRRVLVNGIYHFMW